MASAVSVLLLYSSWSFGAFGGIGFGEGFARAGELDILTAQVQQLAQATEKIVIAQEASTADNNALFKLVLAQRILEAAQERCAVPSTGEHRWMRYAAQLDEEMEELQRQYVRRTGIRYSAPACRP